MGLSTQIGGSAAFAAGASSASIQRRLRVMSENPNHPRVFSQQAIWLGYGILCGPIMTIIMIELIWAYFKGIETIDNILGAGSITLLVYFLFFYGLFRRWGVDDQKVWTRYGKLFYREIRFDQITWLNTGIQRYKLYVGRKPFRRTLVNIDYNRFDYCLVYLNLLKELHRRRFDLPEAKITDPHWEEQAVIWRNILYSNAVDGHQEYFRLHPEEDAYLKSLIPTPAHYAN